MSNGNGWLTRFIMGALATILMTAFGVMYAGLSSDVAELRRETQNTSRSDAAILARLDRLQLQVDRLERRIYSLQMGQKGTHLATPEDWP